MCQKHADLSFYPSVIDKVDWLQTVWPVFGLRQDHLQFVLSSTRYVPSSRYSTDLVCLFNDAPSELTLYVVMIVVEVHLWFI
jgi:hypothetical protein